MSLSHALRFHRLPLAAVNAPVTCCLARFRPVHASANRMADKGDFMDAIIQDHKEIKTYYEQYRTHKNDATEAAKWSNQYRWEVARHSTGEELVVYPAFEQYLPDGHSMAEKDRAQHQEVKNLLDEMERCSAGSERLDVLMEDSMRVLDTHINDEEQHDLPKLRSALDPTEARRLGREFEVTKKFSPTHPHPNAPDKPPFETVAGLLAAPIDRLRDMFKKFPREEEVKSVQPN